MFKKTVVFVALAVFVLGVFALAVVGEEEKPCDKKEDKKEAKKADEKKGPADVIQIDDIADKYKAAPFTHKKHSTEYKVDGKTIACKDCHHDAKKEDASDAKPCFDCHKEDETKTDDGKEIEDLKSVYHDQCKDCHKKAKKAGNKNAVTGCKDCHEKN